MTAYEHQYGSTFYLGNEETRKMLDYQKDFCQTFEAVSPKAIPLRSALKTAARDLIPPKHVSFTLPETVKRQRVDESFNLKTETNAFQGGDMEATKAAVLFMDVPEVLVQLVIDTQHLEPRHKFSNAAQLFQLVDELADDPQRQADLHLKLYQHQQATKTWSSTAGKSENQYGGVGDSTCSVGGDCQELPTGMPEESCQSTTTLSSLYPRSSSSAAVGSLDTHDHSQPEMGRKCGSTKGAALPLSMTTVARAEIGCGFAHNKDQVDQASETSLPCPSITQEPTTPNTPKTSTRRELRKRLKKLAAENVRLTKRKMCRACKKVELSSSGVTFLPCGHFITCEACAEKFDDCPACGKVIMGTVRTFLS